MNLHLLFGRIGVTFQKFTSTVAVAKLPKNIIPQWHQRKHGWQEIWSRFDGFRRIFVDVYNRRSLALEPLEISANEHDLQLFRKHE